MPTPHDAEAAIKIVNDTLVTEFELESGKVTPQANLREDLGLDSLDAVDLVVSLEKSLGVAIPEDIARQMRTVGDIHGYIRKVASERQSA